MNKFLSRLLSIHEYEFVTDMTKDQIYNSVESVLSLRDKNCRGSFYDEGFKIKENHIKSFSHIVYFKTSVVATAKAKVREEADHTVVSVKIHMHTFMLVLLSLLYSFFFLTFMTMSSIALVKITTNAFEAEELLKRAFTALAIIPIIHFPLHLVFKRHVRKMKRLIEKILYL